MIPDDVRKKLEFLLQRAWVNADWREDAEVVLDWLKTLPTPPRPDWDDAPSWAMWWACDPNGQAYWYGIEPLLYETVDFAGWGQHIMQGEAQGGWRFCREYEIPLGVDWRTLIQRRPDSELIEKENQNGL